MTNTQKIELLLCPFCGEESQIIETSVFLGRYETWFKAGCNSCGVYTNAKFCKMAASNIWNLRIKQLPIQDTHHNRPPHANSDLVEILVQYMKDDEAFLSYVNCQAIINALEYREFNPIIHMSDGGFVKNSAGNKFKFVNEGLLSIYVKGWIPAEEKALLCFIANLYENDLHLYEEPPAEGSRVWALEQIAHGKAVRHESWDKCSFTLLKNDTTISDTGWSIFVEPKQLVGWYLVDINMRQAMWWDGMHWRGEPNGPESWSAGPFGFYEKTRYLGKDLFPELETPEA